MRRLFGSLLAFLVAACAGGRATTTTGAGGGNTSGMSGAGNADGDCLTDGEEAKLGTNPNAVDSDGDGISDCDEIACGSDPNDPNQKCYTCGWIRKDPGNLQST